MSFAQEMPWPEIRKQIAAIPKASRLAELLDNVYRHATARKSSLTVLLQKYPWGSEIMVRGVPKGFEHGKQIAFREGYIFPSGCPFGIILKKSCEVCDYWTPTGDEEGHFLEFVPQTIRSSGDTIGLFELQDLLCDSKREVTADWAIFAGARSIECLGNISVTAVKRLRSKFGNEKSLKIETIRSRFPKCAHDHWLFFSQLATVLPDVFSDWTVEIAFLSKAWADEMIEQIGDKKCRPELKDLQLLLAYDAWRKLSEIIEDASGELREQFHTNALKRSIDGSAVIEAFRSIETLYQICCGRRPALELTDQDNELGPFGKMTEILLEMGLPPYVLHPMLLKPGSHGYMNFSRIVPRLQSERTFVRRFQNIENVWIAVVGEAPEGTKLHRRAEMLRNNVVFRLVVSEDEMVTGDGNDRNAAQKTKSTHAVRRARVFDNGEPIGAFFPDHLHDELNKKRVSVFQSVARVERAKRRS